MKTDEGKVRYSPWRRVEGERDVIFVDSNSVLTSGDTKFVVGVRKVCPGHGGRRGRKRTRGSVGDVCMIWPMVIMIVNPHGLSLTITMMIMNR